MCVTFMIMACQISPHFLIITISKDKTLLIVLLWAFRTEYSVLLAITLSVFHYTALLFKLNKSEKCILPLNPESPVVLRTFHLMASFGQQHFIGLKNQQHSFFFLIQVLLKHLPILN